MGEMDELLKQIKAEFNSETKSQTPSKAGEKNTEPNSLNPRSSELTPLNSLIAEVKKEFQQGKKITPSVKSATFFDNSDQVAPSSKNHLIKELQQEYQAKEQQEKQLHTAALKQKAQQWLKNLDCNTDEGLWFEEFSYAYDSKLAAAMDYLAAMEDLN